MDQAYAMMHSINVGVLLLTMAILVRLKRESRVHRAMGGLLHDMGKVKVDPMMLLR